MEEKKKKMGSQFFKIVSNYIIHDRRLGIPTKFVRIFGEQLGKAGLIEDPTGKIWPVELRKAEGEIYFQNGWQELMDYFSVGVGHLLIFRYKGDSHFHVSICDKTACEIEYPCHIDDADKKADASVKRKKSDRLKENTCKPWAFTFNSHPEVVTISSDGESEDENYQNPRDSAKNDEPGKTETIGCRTWAFNAIKSDSNDRHTIPTQPKSVGHGGNHKIPKTGKAKVHCLGQDASCGPPNVHVVEGKFQRAKGVIKDARAFKSKFPTCTIIIKPSHLQKHGLVHVPNEFTRDFLTKAGDNVVTLKDSTGKNWHVDYYIRRIGTSSCCQANLYKGWYDFVLDNRLKVDDACVFELVDIDNLEIKVTIIRVSSDMPTNGIICDSESDDIGTMPTQLKTASHKRNQQISKTGKVKVYCPGKHASCAAPNGDVPEHKFQSAMGVIKEARAFKSVFPTCTIVMKPSYVVKGRAVHVPYEFARDYMAKRGGDFVTLKDSTGKKWDVGYNTLASASKVSLYKGLYEFVLDNHLKVDDACVFELVDIDNHEMKVSIIRASPDMV